ncbi:MAG TPA: glycosyltransferase family 4 protein [Candidatus Sulfotelmatobacter sp.]
MRILFCNKYNFPFSGTEVYLFELMDLLRSQGHQVALFSMADPRGEPTDYDQYFVPHLDFKAKASCLETIPRALHLLYSRDSRKRIRAMIEDFRPDVAHVRNIYHHLSPSILWELKAQGIPVLYHLNDFKLLCPSYNLVSNGESCEACKRGKFRHIIRSECYPGIGQRSLLMIEGYLHKWLGTYRKCVDLFVAPSQFVRDKFVEHGWDARQFEVLPHFQHLPAGSSTKQPSNSVVYFGRLSREKGVDDLLRAMKGVPHMNLTVAGDGPERSELLCLKKALGLDNVEFVGHVRGTALDALVSGSRFTVLPSHAYETLGKTILESYALGKAVVASDLGSRRELVRHGETGLLYPPGDVSRLAEAIESLSSNPSLAEKMGLEGRDLVQQRFTPQWHYDSLLGMYRQLAAKRSSAKSSLVSTSSPAPWEKRQRPKSRLSAFPSRIPATGKLSVAFIGGRGVVSKYSGIETYYEEVGRRLASMGHDVTVYCRSYFTPSLAEHNGMTLKRFPTVRSKHMETVVHTLISTLHTITRPYDVVHYHALGPALFSFIPRMFGKKTVVTVQGLDWQRKKWGRLASAILRLGERASVSLPNSTMVVSHALQQHYRNQHGVEAHYVPNGGILRTPRVPNAILGWDLEPGNYLLFLGRFSPEKGCHLLVEAFENLHTNVKLVMAGASSYCDDYSRELKTHASERIKILDWVSGEVLDELLTNAMIFVLPSDLEGLSLALLDAMGAGLCVVASDVPENIELVEGAGFTFHRGDAEDLTNRLRFLIANPAIREAAGKLARERVLKDYLWSDIALEIEKVYFKMMDWPVSEMQRKKPSTSVKGALAKRQAG